MPKVHWSWPAHLTKEMLTDCSMHFFFISSSRPRPFLGRGQEESLRKMEGGREWPRSLGQRKSSHEVERRERVVMSFVMLLPKTFSVLGAAQRDKKGGAVSSLRKGRAKPSSTRGNRGRPRKNTRAARRKHLLSRTL